MSDKARDAPSPREAIEHLQMSEGWMYVEKFLQERIYYHTNQLKHCPLDEVMKHRHMISAYESIERHLEELKYE